MITFSPKRGMILMCDFDMATVPPEMRKVRRVVVVSPRSYNRPQRNAPGKCVVVPFSATEPRTVLASHVAVPIGVYQSLTKPTLAICEMVAHVSHARMDRVAVGRRFISEEMQAVDLEQIEAGLRHALGFPMR